MTDRFSFDLQRFGGGKGGTTVTQTYEPTQWELTLQMVEATYSVAIMQPAIDLNTYAYNMLKESGGVIPVHYDLLYDDADQKIEAGLAYLQSMMLDLGSNQPPTFGQDRASVEQSNVNYIDEVLGYNDLYLHGTNDLFSWMNDVPRELYEDLRTLKSGLLSFTQAVMTTYEQAAAVTNAGLNYLTSQWTKAQDESHRQLSELDDKLNGKTIMNYADLDELIPQFRDAADDANKNLDDLREKMGEKAEINYGDLPNSATKSNFGKNKLTRAFICARLSMLRHTIARGDTSQLFSCILIVSACKVNYTRRRFIYDRRGAKNLGGSRRTQTRDSRTSGNHSGNAHHFGDRRGEKLSEQFTVNGHGRRGVESQNRRGFLHADERSESLVRPRQLAA